MSGQGSELPTLVRALRVCGGVIFALAVLAVLLPPDAATPVAGVMAAVLVATPLARLLALAVRWLSRGDRRFGLAALALLALVAAGWAGGLLAS